MLKLFEKLKRAKGVGEIFTPSGSYSAEWQGGILVVGRSNSSTIDFYFKSRGNAGITLVDVLEFEQEIHAIKPGSILILVRDVPLKIIKQIEQLKNLAGVIWFIDDDIPGMGAETSLPKPYRKRLSQWYCQARPLLETVCDKIWVSTPYLARKYDLDDSSVLAPIPPRHEGEKSLVRCFYHGSSSHACDWDFILKVVKRVQQRNKHIWFEFIGDHALYKRCKSIPRINILHPMSWENYLMMTDLRTMDIGLVPLIDTEFNRARSHTKFIDICRQGAVGIYSTGVQFSDQIKACEAGIVLENIADDWVLAIESLASSDRPAMRANAQELLESITANSSIKLAEMLD